MTRLIFFDLDGTLIGSPSSERAFLQHLFFGCHIGIKQCWHAMFFLLRWAHRYKHYVFLKDKAYLTGLSSISIELLAEELTQKKLLPRVRPGLKACIVAHRRAKDINVLLTGSHEFIARVFAKHLGIEEIQATKCVVCDGKFANVPPLQHPFRAEKLAIAKKICEKYGTTIDNCVAYANSINDQMLLRAVGRPVVVTPDRGLRRIALKENWEIITGK